MKDRKIAHSDLRGQGAMMKICIGDSPANAVLMEKIWRFRHQQFVE
ncbi:autoinducer synthase, partial [Rhizobium ruizarguesonis]